jgi:microcystin-dependent protein
VEGNIGEIRMTACDFAPIFWAFCDGRELSVSENIELFTLIGFSNGGDGFTKFNLPRIADLAPGVRYIMCVQGLASKP